MKPAYRKNNPYQILPAGIAHQKEMDFEVSKLEDLRWVNLDKPAFKGGDLQSFAKTNQIIPLINARLSKLKKSLKAKSNEAFKKVGDGLLSHLV